MCLTDFYEKPPLDGEKVWQNFYTAGKKIVDKTEIVQISVKDGGRGVGPYSLKLGAI